MASHELESLQELYVEQLRDLYDAEKQIMDALPKMYRTTTSHELRNAFEEHLEQTRHQANRLEQIFEDLGVEVKGEKCKGIQGIIEEGEELMDRESKADDRVMDAGLIASAQRVEHYEIAGYGTVRTWAMQLGRSQDVSLLEQTLEEEKETDQKLSMLAESKYNPAAIKEDVSFKTDV
jgi:ferritin-like metal-binding protein YciE